jgi:4-hydroxy-tetrahydrodipicolinate synthase
MFDGAFTALVTPFANGKVDFKTLGKLIESQIGAGISGLVPCGTTGESATLTEQERKDIIKATVETAGRRVPVIVGTGSNDTRETTERTAFAKEVGADAALLVTPYYNKPTPQGLFQHYKTVAEQVDIPIILYNVPSRTGVSLPVETVAALSQIPNIVAIKEASGNLAYASEIMESCKITVLSGEDSLTLPILALGARGVISVVSNILPHQTEELVRAYLNGKTERAREIHFQMLPLMRALFVETNPAPVKEAMAYLGLIEPEIRLPLVRVTEKSRRVIIDALKKCGLGNKET